MAEVRKKVVKDDYNTSKIKKKENKVANKNSTKKGTKTVSKNDTVQEKQNFFVKFRIFCNGVKGEFKKVHWTSKKDMIKYSIAVVVFIIFCALFFYLIDVLFALLQSALS